MKEKDSMPHPHAKAKGSGLATASLVLAIVSLPLTILYFAGLLTAVVAISLGHIALRRAKHSPHLLFSKNKAIAGLLISYLYIGFAVVLVVTIVSNRVSKTHFSDDTGMDFALHTPLKGTSSEWQIKHQAPLVVVMAPQEVEISPSPQLNVSVPFAPTDASYFQFLTIKFLPKKYDKTVVDVCRQLTSGTRVFDKTYQATDPESTVIAGTPSVFFRESLIIQGTHTKGIVFLVPCSRGYYILSFRADPNTYYESFYRRIAGTFRPKEP